jgi:hypothetical protein
MATSAERMRALRERDCDGSPMTVRGGGDPMDSMAYHAVTENGSRPASTCQSDFATASK